MITRNYFYKSIVKISLLVSLTISNYAAAEEQASISFGALSNSIKAEHRLTIAKESSTASIVDQQSGKATGKTRTELHKIKQLESNRLSKELKKPSLAQNKSYNNPAYTDFAIYGATTLLQDDYDSDGFYQTFSVTFDADIVSYTSHPWDEVYALLYISKNGGPWTHYYTTDNFLIEGDTDSDEYEVITTFLSGYSTNQYDILIDLYQEGYGDVVASYSSDDSNALYALPLESADYDEPYIEVVEISHGGSFSVAIIMLFLLMYLVRTKANEN
jgi:hypothetical protein